MSKTHSERAEKIAQDIMYRYILGELQLANRAPNRGYDNVILAARQEDSQRFSTHAYQAKDLIPHNLRWNCFYGMNDVIMQGQGQ